MNHENNHDPVSALSEADATGRTAEIFADIRTVMQIPLITSIWRTLADIDGGLETAWAATRPIYESGQADAIVEKLKTKVHFPMPDLPPLESLKAAGFEGENRRTVLAILDAYNRSNSLNLIALTALVCESDGQRSDYPRPPPPSPWPKLPALLSKEEINGTDWELLEKIKHIGASFDNPALPTLWRHLIHWPNLVRLIYESYLPLHQDGTINRAIEQVGQFVKAEAPAIAWLKTSTDNLPTEAMEMIRGYVGKPPAVSRMVTVGQGVAVWLKR